MQSCNIGVTARGSLLASALPAGVRSAPRSMTFPGQVLLFSVMLFAAACAAVAQPDDVAPPVQEIVSLPLDDAASLDVARLDPVERRPLHGGPFPWPAGAGEEPAGDVTDEQIDTFAEIYVDLEKQTRRFERAIAHADSEEEAQEIQARLQAESLKVIEKRGWSADEFDRVARLLNRRPDLAAKALSAIDEKDSRH